MLKLFGKNFSARDETIGSLIILGCFVLVFSGLFYHVVANLFSGSWMDGNSTSPSDAPDEVAARIASPVDRALGQSNRRVNGTNKPPKLYPDGLKVQKDDFGNVIDIKWALNEGDTDHKTSVLAREDISKVLNTLVANGGNFHIANLSATFPMRNSSGDIVEQTVIRTTYRGDDLRNEGQVTPEKVRNLAIAAEFNPRFQ